MKKKSNKQSNNVKNSLNNNKKNSKITNNCKRINNVKNSTNNEIGFEEDSDSFTLDENDDHSFELR